MGTDAFHVLDKCIDDAVGAHLVDTNWDAQDENQALELLDRFRATYDVQLIKTDLMIEQRDREVEKLEKLRAQLSKELGTIMTEVRSLRRAKDTMRTASSSVS